MRRAWLLLLLGLAGSIGGVVACDAPVDDLMERRSNAARAVAAEDGGTDPEDDDPEGDPSATMDGADDPPASASGCALKPTAKAAYLRSGLHPRASDALAAIGFPASRITQTIGSAAASAGTHARDGSAEVRDYTAAVDLSVRDMSDAEASKLLDQLTEVGFVAWLRQPGADGWPSSEVRHVHAIWVAAPMKASLQAQIRDFRVGKNGLASHTTYKFKTWSTCWRETIWAAFRAANPG